MCVFARVSVCVCVCVCVVCVCVCVYACGCACVDCMRSPKKLRSHRIKGLKTLKGIVWRYTRSDRTRTRDRTGAHRKVVEGGRIQQG